jgi:hypothetical protein
VRSNRSARAVVVAVLALVVSITSVVTSVVAAPADARSAPQATAKKGCPAESGQVERPTGPSAEAVVAQEAGGRGPAVSLVRYPRPDTEGAPWSHWGQGLVLGDGRFLSGMGNHLGKDGNSFLFVYDPATGSITRFADVRSEVGDDLDWGYGKIHGQIVAGRCGEAYLTTYWGTRRGLVYTPEYRGDLMFRIDPSTLELTPIGAVVPEHGIPSLAAAPSRGLVYGEAVDPLPAPDLGRDQGSFFVYDTRAGEVVFDTDTPQHIGFRNVMVDARGRAYIAAEGGRLLLYEPGASTLQELSARLPGGGWLRASTLPARDGTVYGATKNPDHLFAMDADGSIEDFGAAQGYTTSMAVEPDGSRFYYVPGAHGATPDLGTPIVAVDTETKQQTTIARLDELVEQRLKLHTAGSYGVVLDPDNRRLYVALNAGTDVEEPWGEVVLAIVDLS